MLLHHLHLENIRSYTDEMITFPEGSLLLSGDIGSGKSSILLAVEFALFGASRPDLPAEALLRKGATQGSVELSFSLEGKEHTIKRILKKTKQGIQQTAGYMLVQGVKKELTPIELKAEMISLLGYPEEQITKNKNYLFRYTVYTPQEEMKLILQEAAESRLDVLRKIFNSDKYQLIRENVQLYLRTLRTRIAVLETKIVPLEEQKAEVQTIQDETRAAREQVSVLEQERALFQQQLQQEKQQLDLWEKAQQEFRDLLQQKKTKTLLLEEKRQQGARLWEQEEELQRQGALLDLHGLPPRPKEEILRELQQKEADRDSLLNKRSARQERLQHVREQIQHLQEELQVLDEEVALITPKRSLFKEMRKKVQELSAEEGKDVQLLDLLEKTNALLTMNQTILQQAQDVQKTLQQLDSCPTCLQKVTALHKKKITTEKEQEISKAGELLQELQEKKQQMLLQRKIVQERLTQYYQQQNFLTRLELELQHLESKIPLQEKKREELRKMVQVNNSLLGEESQGEEEQLSKLAEAVLGCREQLDVLTKRMQLEKQVARVREQQCRMEQDVAQLQKIIQELEQEVLRREDFSDRLPAKKQSVDQLREQEKRLVAQEERQRTILEHLQAREERLQRSIEELTVEKARLLRTKELFQWLEEYFTPLTATIEKQVMVRIHHLFNQLFQEWFSLLMDDEAITARLDESFTPIIEQNGHELFFENLSGGEKTSAALAYRLALNKVINDIVHEIKTKDVLILDEPTDGFSTEQLDKMREVLDRLALRQVILVSHEAKMESFVSTVIRVQKAGHVSTVVC